MTCPCNGAGFVWLMAFETRSVHYNAKPANQPSRAPHTKKEQLLAPRIRHAVVKFRAPCFCEAGDVFMLSSYCLQYA